MSAANDKIAYTIKEACEATGVGRSTIYELMSEGRLRKVKLGTRTLIPRSELEALFAPEADAA